MDLGSDGDDLGAAPFAYQQPQWRSLFVDALADLSGYPVIGHPAQAEGPAMHGFMSRTDLFLLDLGKELLGPERGGALGYFERDRDRRDECPVLFEIAPRGLEAEITS